jgi:NCS1 family nucleobase:cation symporter-1
VLGYGIANIWFYALGAIYGLAASGGERAAAGALAQAGGGLACC